jgi:hypothetical protein
MALSLHLDASTTTNLFTNYNGGSPTGAPNDGDEVQVWQDFGDSINTTFAAEFNLTTSASPNFRSNTPLMAHSCLDYDGSADATTVWQNLLGTVPCNLSNVGTATDITIIAAIYPEAITSAQSNPYDNHTIVGDVGQFMGLHLKTESGTSFALAYNYDGNVDVASTQIASSQSWVLAMTHSSNVLAISKNGGTFVTTASGNTAALNNQMAVGFNVMANPTSLYNGRIGELKIWNTGNADGNLNTEISSMVSKWINTATNLTGGGLDTLQKLTEKGGGNIGLGGGARETLKAFTESGGGTIQSNTTNLTGGASDTLRALLDFGGGNIGPCWRRIAAAQGIPGLRRRHQRRAGDPDDYTRRSRLVGLRILRRQ